MTVFDIFANMGLLVGDIFTAIALIGTALLFVSVASGRRIRKTPEQIWTWAVLGTFVGVLCFGSILLTQTPAQRIGFIFGWSPSLVGGLLALAVALLGMSAALSLARRGQPVSKYDPLHKYLTDIPAAQTDVTLRFNELERVLGERLPASAYTHRPWWANEIGGQHMQAHAWVQAGWAVDGVDLAGEWVRFRRV